MSLELFDSLLSRVTHSPLLQLGFLVFINDWSEVCGEVIHYEAKKLHPRSFCNSLIKLRSSMPIFCKQLPECICNKTV